MTAGPALSSPRGGAVAAGDPSTAAAAIEILSDGGNAVDAAVAAMCTACVAEPVLASLGGGGFLLARQADGRASLCDFFVQTPRRKRPQSAIDFKPILADFGTATQEFQIGLGAAATPGLVAGLFAAHRAFGRLPMHRLVEPAVRLARDGVRLSQIQGLLLSIVAPIPLSHPASAERFASPADPKRLIAGGERFRWPALADTLEALAREGEDLFYRGEIAERIAAQCRHGGGHLTAHDLAAYRVIERRPLALTYRRHQVLTNPPPSSGGVLIAFALALLEPAFTSEAAFGSPAHLRSLARVMRLTGRARLEARIADAAEAAADRLFGPDLLRRYRQEVLPFAQANRGTTHISIIDRAGAAASVTLSNGEGCGVMAPDDAFMLNNMLGEEDLNPRGFHRWPKDTRLSSMMAPTLATAPDGALIALGSGGSNRIRSAILQVLVNLIDYGMTPEQAVRAPRLHFEGDFLDIEPGFSDEAVAAAAGEATGEKLWPAPNLFFGGVHTVWRKRSGVLGGAGDPRRGGVVEII